MATKKKNDPRIYLPLVEGSEYRETEFVSGTASAGGTDLDLPPMTSPGLQPPGDVRIVEQIFRKGPDGRTVVDLIIEVESVQGANEYEVRTSLA